MMKIPHTTTIGDWLIREERSFYLIQKNIKCNEINHIKCNDGHIGNLWAGQGDWGINDLELYSDSNGCCPTCGERPPEEILFLARLLLLQ